MLVMMCCSGVSWRSRLAPWIEESSEPTRCRPRCCWPALVFIYSEPEQGNINQPEDFYQPSSKHGW
jgi:hypothetical protein